MRPESAHAHTGPEHRRRLGSAEVRISRPGGVIHHITAVGRGNVCIELLLSIHVHNLKREEANTDEQDRAGGRAEDRMIGPGASVSIGQSVTSMTSKPIAHPTAIIVKTRPETALTRQAHDRRCAVARSVWALRDFPHCHWTLIRRRQGLNGAPRRTVRA